MFFSLILFDLFYQIYQAQAYPSRQVTRSDLGSLRSALLTY